MSISVTLTQVLITDMSIGWIEFRLILTRQSGIPIDSDGVEISVSPPYHNLTTAFLLLVLLRTF